MTTTPIKAELPTSEIPLTFKDGKIQPNLSLAIDTLNDGTLGFKSEEVTEENLLNRICSFDLYPEAVSAIHWTLKSLLETEWKLVQEEHEKTGKPTTAPVAVELTLLNRVVKFLEAPLQHYNIEEEKVQAFTSCIYEVANCEIGKTKKLAYEMLDVLEDFIHALGNFQAESKVGDPIDKEFCQMVFVTAQMGNLVGCARATLSDLVNN